MSAQSWTQGEKRIARRVFEAALERELAEVMAEFKARAARAQEPDDRWATQEYLAQARRDIDRKYDYRYSQLELVFAILLREQRIAEAELEGLADEKLAVIRGIASF